MLGWDSKFCIRANGATWVTSVSSTGDNQTKKRLVLVPTLNVSIKNLPEIQRFKIISSDNLLIIFFTGLWFTGDAFNKLDGYGSNGVNLNEIIDRTIQWYTSKQWCNWEQAWEFPRIINRIWEVTQIKSFKSKVSWNYIISQAIS